MMPRRHRVTVGRSVAAMWLTLAALLLLVTHPGGAARTAAPRYTLSLVQLVHRHGARGVDPVVNRSRMCTDRAAPCGRLNRQGAQMMEALGDLLRQRYNATDSEAYWIDGAQMPSAYSPSYMYSRSSDALPALQSASAVVHGVFDHSGAAPVLPAIRTTGSEVDVLLNVTAIPSFLYPLVFHGRSDANGTVYPFITECLNATAHTTPSLRDVLTDMGSEVQVGDLCADPDDAILCVAALYDAATASHATGTLSDYPHVEGNYDCLTHIMRKVMATVFAHDDTSALHRTRGSPGQHLAQELLANMRATARRTTGDDERYRYSITHYSGDDFILNALAATLGASEERYLLPAFGGAVLLELYAADTATPTDPGDNAADDGDDAFFVRALRAWPERAAAARRDASAESYAYAYAAFPLHCMAANGTVYSIDDHLPLTLEESGSRRVNPDTLCPYDDVARFVRSTVAADPAGDCFLTDAARREWSAACVDAAPAVHDDDAAAGQRQERQRRTASARQSPPPPPLHRAAPVIWSLADMFEDTPARLEGTCDTYRRLCPAHMCPRVARTHYYDPSARRCVPRAAPGSRSTLWTSATPIPYSRVAVALVATLAHGAALALFARHFYRSIRTQNPTRPHHHGDTQLLQ